MLFVTSFIVFVSKNPTMLMLSLLLTTLFITMNMFVILKSQIISLIILIVIVGGLMIMFMYMVSLLPNMKMSNISKTSMISFYSLLMAMNFLISKTCSFPQDTNLSQIYTNPTMCFFLILYLLFTMFSAISIINLNKSPIRSIYEKF